MSDVTCHWCEALEHAFGLAKGSRLNELRGTHPRRFDARGLDAFSECWGRVLLAETLEPVLSLEGIATTPQAMREQASADALGEFLVEAHGG